MACFSDLDAYRIFESRLKLKARDNHWAYDIPDDWTRQFLATVEATSAKRQLHLRAGRSFWRAQLGGVEKTDRIWSPDGQTAIPFVKIAPHPPERMKPTPAFATGGRANRCNVPVLYLAKDAKTAKAEMRPCIGGHLSLGKFKLVRNCRIINLSADEGPSRPRLGILSADEAEKRVWRDISCAFSKPLGLGDKDIEYLPTQILAETFREAGFDGVQYRSLLKSGGENVVLFDLDSAQQIAIRLCLTTQINYKYEFIE